MEITFYGSFEKMQDDLVTAMKEANAIIDKELFGW